MFKNWLKLKIMEFGIRYVIKNRGVLDHWSFDKKCASIVFEDNETREKFEYLLKVRKELLENKSGKRG